MPHIRQLDPSLVNKIAAGEVIERPASVVKELLENALDAGATRIDVALEEGGVGLIRVTDNGCGIAPEDLLLAVAPHATSKLTSSDDLFAIRTLGFRGEALASIASVSHLRISSRTEDRIDGHELLAADGRIEGPRPCAAPIGTTIEVRNLFFNVPARRKFLRQGPTEFSHATEQLARLALAHPGVAFTLTHNGRTARNLPLAQGRRQRIGDFYGNDLADCLLVVDRQERSARIEALIAPPAHSRASSKWQYLFLNGRYITDRRINYAIREAYRGLVEHDRYPVVFVFITTDPTSYDVNVHPTKIEVRWRDSGLIQSQVLAVLRETLLSHDLTPRLGFRREEPGEAAPADTAHQQRTREALADYLKSIDPTQARLRFAPPPFPTKGIRPSILATPVAAPPPSALAHGHDDFTRVAPFAPCAFGDSNVGDGTPDTPSAESTSQRAETPAEATVSKSRLDAQPAASSVIQVHNTYLVAQTDDGIVIIDQHALHERILYERFRERFLAGPLESQRLLIPPTFDASPIQMQVSRDQAELLSLLGIEVSEFGPRQLAVQSFPVLMGEVEPAVFVGDLLDKLADTGEAQSRETLVHSALDMMACKAAVKAGDPLTQEEMTALLAQRHLVDRSSNCPHGRPTSLQLTTRDLERQFKRS
ncbi:MAG: DNA mismatch repair endonuclease MutL [Planctomycetota bacterium]|nr:MAG: DNA mismatch repair endonuclease MutL [Planctomycetota bacterium]